MIQLTPEVRRSRLTDQPMEILQFADGELKAGRQCALVTLVEIDGGAARALGAQMTVSENGEYCGYVSGGCVEATVARDAVIAIAKAEDKLLRLGRGSPYFDIILPCGGGITMMIHVIRQAERITELVSGLKRREEMALEFRTATGELTVSESKQVSGWNGETFVTGYMPVLQILLYGRGIEPEAFSELAEAAGIAVINAHEESSVQVDPYTAIVLLQHDIDKDMPVLQRALATNAFYIGCLGSRQTHQQRSQRLAELGFLPLQIRRIHAPIGMWGPTRDARSLAISVLAEILAHYQKL